MGIVVFFCSACAQEHDILKAPVHFEDILSKEALRIFDKACKGFRVESLPVEICQDMFQKLFLLGLGITYTDAASAAVHVLAFAPSY